ncbi:MAG: nucleotidyltransferase family protein [Lentisphaeria bacterium]|nr:nucleotidyltransferase family protein [Lentisphaeria bacterium]
MCQLDRLRSLRGEIYEIARKHKADKVYVFGSCARKEETPESDVDFLVELQKGASLFDLMDLQDEYEALLSCKVDVVSRRGLNPYLRDNVLSEAVVL